MPVSPRPYLTTCLIQSVIVCVMYVMSVCHRSFTMQFQSAMASDELQALNVLTGLDDDAVVRKRTKEPSSLEQTEADKQIVQQLVSHILNSGNAATEQPSTGLISGAPNASMVPVSGLDIGALISLAPGNVMAVPVPPSGTFFQYQQGLAPLAASQPASGVSVTKSASVGPVATLSTDTKVTMATKPVPQVQSPQLVNPTKPSTQHLLNAPGPVMFGAGGTSQANMVLTAPGQHQQAPIVLTSQTQVIRTANGQTAILLNAPAASAQGIAQMPGPGALGGAVQLQSLSAGALAGAPVQTNLGNVITIPLGSLASTLKLSGIPFQPVPMSKAGSEVGGIADAATLPLIGQGGSSEEQGEIAKEVEEGVVDKNVTDQHQTHSLMEMLQDESQLQKIIVPLSSKEVAGMSVPLATTTAPQVSSTSVSNVVFTTTTPQPTILSPSTQLELSGKKAFTASRKRPLEMDETMDSDIEAFVQRFKQHRSKLNYTQIDVGRQLAEKYGHGLSQTTICRFESSMLSPQNMRKIMEWLEKWMAEATCKYPNGEASVSKKSRKRRTTLNPTIKASLEDHFMTQPKPGSQELSSVADKLGLDYEVVRVWFCNRRQKIRRESSNIHDSSSELLVDAKHDDSTD